MSQGFISRTIKFFGALVAAISIQTIAHAQNVIPGEYIVVLKNGVRALDVANAHALQPKRLYAHALNGFAGKIPDAKLAALKNDPRVALLEADVKVFAYAQSQPTGIRRIGTSSAAKIDGIDERVNADIAVLDTGIDLTHPDLDVYRAVSFTTDSTDGNDGNGHGTHVAGIAAALDNGAGVVGVAPGARLWAVKVLDNTGSGALSGIIKGIDYVTQNASQIEVANLSLGAQGSSDSLRLAIQNSVAKGVVFVVAAGNSNFEIYGGDATFGTWDDFFPANYPEVMTVSAMADTDGKAGGTGTSTSYGADDTLATFSNWSSTVVPNNPVTSPGAAIDVAAPGVDIFSTYKGGQYATMSGTSMASPHVAGAVALYVSQYGRATDAAGVARIRQAFIDHAEPESNWGINPTNPFRNDPNLEPLLNVAWITGTPGQTQPTNNKPVVSITSPANGSAFNAGTTVTLSGTASDVEDGNVSAKIVWTSSINGNLGTGATVSAALSSGTHTITAKVTDNAGATTTTSITVIVNSPTVSMSSITTTDKSTYYNRNTVNVGVIVSVPNGSVSGAAVHIVITGATGKTYTADSTTDGSGVATLQYTINTKRDGIGTYKVTTTSSKSGYTSATSSTTFNVSR